MPEIAELSRAVLALTGEVRRLAKEAAAVIVRQQTQRRLLIGLLGLGTVVFAIAISSVLQAAANCHYARGNRAGLHDILELARAASPPTPTSRAFFDRAERLTPPIHCGAGTIAGQVGRGAGIAFAIEVVFGLVLLVALPCGRRTVADWLGLTKDGGTP